MLLNSKPVLCRTSLTTVDYIAARNNAVWGQASLSHPCGCECPVATNRAFLCGGKLADSHDWFLR
ncbi:hypothetical protein T4D_7556 [Trichinella pseudospiralis]|uniref:Uncharacterized protein n=1 Tax=Trichinella pseudospiralis TaxID=6337 RepID=A0A0V1F7U5_TRIPS|nr:hypothetical protein T4D_7556 [Trichinella pseudospiralis]